VIVSASFAPTATGNASGSISVSSSVSGTTTTIALTGTGVAGAPSLTTQPTNQSVTTGQTATFSAVAAGTAPLSYQWQKNGTAVSGATSANYTTPATAMSDSGAQFTVLVSNPSGNVTSSPAVLTVTAAGQLTASTTNLGYGNVSVGSSSTQPVTLTNTGGTSVSILKVTLSGIGVSISGVSSGLILAAGNSAALNVTFAPSASGNPNGSVTITSTATNPTVTISLLGTTVQPVSHSAAVFWTFSPSSVAGYNVYRSSVSGGPYTRLNSSLITSTTYTDSTVLASQTYFYIPTSVDSTGNESLHSKEVSCTIPRP
jgi:hypothetical protein